MGQLTISHNFSGELNFIVGVPKLTTAPLADVICTIDGVTGQTRIAYAFPHSQVSLLIENLQNAWYTVKFYRSADGTSLDEELLTLAGNALADSVFPIIKYDYVVGRGDADSGVDETWHDPIAGDHGIRDERLLNKVYWVEERGTGTLLPVEIVDRSDDGGGFDFADTDKIFNDGGVYFVTVIEREDGTASAGPSGSSDYNDILILAADQDYDPVTMGSKLLIANWGTTVGALDIPNFSLVADSKFKLQTHGGSQRNVIIQLDAGNTVQFRGAVVNKIILGKGEMIECLFKSNVMYILDYDGDYARVGRRVYADMAELNSLPLDGTQYQQADYPRLVEYVNNLPGGQIVSEVTWASVVVIDGVNKTPYKGFYAVEGSTIRVPDERNMGTRTLKTFDSVDASDTERVKNVPGGYQKDGIGPLNLVITGVKIQKAGSSNHIIALGNIDDTNLGTAPVTVPVSTALTTREENIGQLKIVII